MGPDRVDPAGEERPHVQLDGGCRRMALRALCSANEIGQGGFGLAAREAHQGIALVKLQLQLPRLIVVRWRHRP